LGMFLSNMKVVHKFICALCNKKSRSVPQAREHFRECATNWNDSLSRKSVVRTAVQCVRGPAKGVPTTAGQKLGDSAFVGAQTVTQNVGKLSLAPHSASAGPLLGFKLMSSSAVSGVKGSPATGGHLAKEAATIPVIFKNIYSLFLHTVFI
jgi:hypothetical protein